jgi:hypothetical protein
MKRESERGGEGRVTAKHRVSLAIRGRQKYTT